MPEPVSIKVALDRLAVPVVVEPGGEIVLRGAYHSKHDGSIVDAATTTWPAEAPGGASVDAGGLIDLEAGGFHMTSRDPVTHEVHAVAKSEPGQACAALGVSSPCLPLRLQKQAVSRLMTMGDWASSLKDGGGQISLTVINPPAYAPPPAAVPYVGGAAVVLALGLAGVVGARWWKKRAESPAAQLVALARRVEDKLTRADAVLAAPLAPAITVALRSLKNRKVDASSAEGKRVADVLKRVELRLDESVHQQRAEEEQRAADELVREMESALEAADEARLSAKL
ncbi:Hypothetical protein A7982_09591 [Minicystis rosea]|nr:Hypothetical protein A7982_09591 [Minicystis rosea]